MSIASTFFGLVIVSPKEIRESGFYFYFSDDSGPFLPIGRKIFAFGTKRKAQFKDETETPNF